MTEGPRVNFVMCEALFEIYTWILCLSYLHEKQTSRIQSLYLYFIKIVPFLLQNIRFLKHNSCLLFYGRHYSSLHCLMSLHAKMDVKIVLMFIVAENTRSVNIFGNNCTMSLSGLPVDLIAHVFDVLRNDLKSDIAKELFLYYQSTPVILQYLKPVNKVMVICLSVFG